MWQISQTLRWFLRFLLGGRTICTDCAKCHCDDEADAIYTCDGFSFTDLITGEEMGAKCAEINVKGNCWRYQAG